jgi:hypothetical protein
MKDLAAQRKAVAKELKLKKAKNTRLMNKAAKDLSLPDLLKSAGMKAVAEERKAAAKAKGKGKGKAKGKANGNNGAAVAVDAAAGAAAADAAAPGDAAVVLDAAADDDEL